MIRSQILVPDVALPVTGPEPIHVLAQELAGRPATKPVGELLAAARNELRAMDAAGLGPPPERYRALARSLEALPTKGELPRLFHVDMVKPDAGATLGAVVVAEIVAGVEVLRRLAPPADHESLRRFREAFVARYGGREVRLLAAMDEEAGIGFGGGGETSPLIRGLDLPEPHGAQVRWGARENLLLRRLSEALRDGRAEIALGPQDIEAMAAKDPPPFPRAFAVLAALGARDAAGLACGDFRLFIEGVAGPPGARLLGRFCHADQAFDALVRAHLAAEEALDSDALHAELVHLPEGRQGNNMLRPVLRRYEIPYLGRSGAPPGQQIPVTDLLVSVEGETIVLRSARLGRPSSRG